MIVNMQTVSPEGLAHIMCRLRPRDRREIFALRWDDDDDRVISELCQIAGDLWKMWTLDGEPVAVSGVAPMRPGVVIAGSFGTDKWRHVTKPMIRWSRDFVIPCLKNSGYHRAEAYVMASNTDSRRWIELLGGEVEALLKGYGREREDFLLYARDLTREGDEHVLRRRRRRYQRTADGDRARGRRPDLLG